MAIQCHGMGDHPCLNSVSLQPVFSSVLHGCSRTREGVFISIPVDDLEGFADLFMRMTRDQVFPLEDVVASFYPFLIVPLT